MAFYLAIAVLASALLAGGLVMMKSRAAALPKVSGADGFWAVLAWIRDPMWIGGIGVQTTGYALYVCALTGAPISVLAVAMQAGIAMFVVFAVVILGERAAWREWTGIAAIVAAMVLLSTSLSSTETGGAMDWRALAGLAALLIITGLVPNSSQRLRENGVAAAIFSGVAFGLGALFTKAMTVDFMTRPSIEIVTRIATNPYVYLATVGNLTGLVMLQSAFQATRGIVAVPLSSAISNLVPIAGGMVAFGEGLPADHVAATMRIMSFALTIIAGGLLAGAEEKLVDAAAPTTG